MKTIKKCVVGLALLSAVPMQSWAVAFKTKTLPYKIENDEYEGLISVPAGTPKGGLLVVHNWMGVTAETRKQAERFAALGYLVVSADIYGKGKNPAGPEQAGKLASSFKSDRKLFRTRLTGALNELSKRPEIKNKPLFAAGYCFGGTGVVELARTGANLKAIMSFHGGLDSPVPADGANIKATVYAFHGADDPYESASDLAGFEKEMSTNKVDWQLVKFGGAVHSFTDMTAGTDASKGAAYNASADARSFEMAEKILK